VGRRAERRAEQREKLSKFFVLLCTICNNVAVLATEAAT